MLIKSTRLTTILLVAILMVGCLGSKKRKSVKSTFSLDPQLYESAVQYGFKSRFLSDYDFILYDNGSMIPTPIIKQNISPTDDYPYCEWTVKDIMPIEKRKINAKYAYKGEGMDDFVEVVEKLSAKRLRVNFEKLYRDFGWIVRGVMSKSDYMERYAPTVDMLLLVYSDLEANPELYKCVAEVMRMHWTDAHSEPYIGLPDYYVYLRAHLSSEMADRLEGFFLSGNTDYQNNYMIIWSYSFWLRRNNEGKTTEIYNTLCAIKADFES